MPSIVDFIKEGKLRLGHVQRMLVERLLNKIMNARLGGNRLRGRLGLRWLNDMENNLKQLAMRGWQRKMEDLEE